MALSRNIDWATAVRAVRSKPAPGFLASRSLESARLDRLARDAAVRIAGAH
jgi:hypothetical protein